MTGPDHGYRLSDDERDEALERLRTALSEGRLGLDEHESRSTAALNAVTNADLAQLFDDLPPRLRPTTLTHPEEPPADLVPAEPQPKVAAAAKDGSGGRAGRVAGPPIWGAFLFVMWGLPAIISGNQVAIITWLSFFALVVVPGLAVATTLELRARRTRRELGGGRDQIEGA
ncbi:hypothetical protein BJF83_12785 [Nocardiopsis sp. CNR-923]|uniref:DUF1707 SHOCT-like domain-containing protein n=1 Tax=Nocardiopsis sp. CNR-923 TaxID=1904965 RepID=UPI00095D2F7B|nr:DUF1707 domain-containing protein [Nocardiopsis sp. CNR-923]OLT29000.1 hypothetical protein BJF83_12785 [Nocardiopsis sp. CNR-923]